MNVSAALTLILKSFAVFSLLLLLGTLLRAKVRIFQNLYLPACVIGGAIGLILGPNCLNIVPIPADIMSVASSLPGVLIVPVLAAVPMCVNSMGGKLSMKTQNDIIILTILVGLVSFFQFVLGLFVNVVYTAVGEVTYKTLGLELPMGFTGGHGLAGTLGSSLHAMGAPYWEVSQGLAMTSATVGLIGGIIIGVWMINFAARRGYTTVVKSAGEITREYKVGYYVNETDCPSLGKQTTIANSIETLSLHLALILVASGIGYLINDYLAQFKIDILSAMSTWFYAMVVMAIIWPLIRVFKVDFLFDETVKNKITGFLSDFLIVAAMMSIPLKLVIAYWLPSLTMFIMGLILTPLMVYFICKRYLENCWFEKAMGPLGCLTGVYITGMLLTKMADPDLKTPALKDYSMGYTLSSFFAIPLYAFLIAFTYSNGAFAGMLASLGVTMVCVAALLILGRKKR